jgi:hypothetical protein
MKVVKTDLIFPGLKYFLNIYLKITLMLLNYFFAELNFSSCFFRIFLKKKQIEDEIT